jgi:predicted DsbA family dithiol-disulfide isomerase
MDDANALVFFFDYIDPGSYLIHRQLQQLLPDGVEPHLHPLEVRPAPQALIDVMDPDWSAYEETVTGLARGGEVQFTHPAFVPWSAKAHELRLHAADQGRGPDMHEEIFAVHFQEGGDIGRVDVLVAVAERIGLDPSEAKAVLDIDKHRDRLGSLREEAQAAGVRRAPTLHSGTTSLVGPASIGELRHFLENARFL